MLHQSWRFVAVVSLALFVAACEPVLPPITISGDLVAEVYDPVGGGSPAVQESGQIAGNETLYFALSVPSARDLLFAEVDGSDLRVTLLTEGGSTLAVSDDPKFFAASTAGLSAARAEVGLESISTNFFCIGPCAAVRPQSDGYLVAVRNLSGSSRSYDLSAYTMNATDGNEPNGSSASAVGFGSGDGVFGAIEWLGDDDWFRYDGATNRQLSLRVFDLAPGVALQFQSDGVVVRGSLAGTTVLLRPDDVFRVYSEDGRAGPSASSRYSITTTASSDPPITITGELVAEVYDPLGGGSPTVQESGQVPGNATLYFELSVPSARDLLFAEVDGSDLRVTLLTEGGSTLAVSDDPNFFAASTAGLSVAAEVGLDSISTNFFCIGPCAAVRPQSDGYLVAVRNLSGSSRSYDLSAYTMDATDGNEPNGSSASAVGFGSGDGMAGAIEWLGDEDWFRFDGATNRQLSISVTNLAPGVALQLQRTGGIVRGSLAGATIDIVPGDLFRVFSLDGRAGPSASSRYSIATTEP